MGKADVWALRWKAAMERRGRKVSPEGLARYLAAMEGVELVSELARSSRSKPPPASSDA